MLEPDMLNNVTFVSVQAPLQATVSTHSADVKFSHKAKPALPILSVPCVHHAQSHTQHSASTLFAHEFTVL